jgi:hypothetical protein
MNGISDANSRIRGAGDSDSNQVAVAFVGAVGGLNGRMRRTDRIRRPASLTGEFAAKGKGITP